MIVEQTINFKVKYDKKLLKFSDVLLFYKLHLKNLLADEVLKVSVTGESGRITMFMQADIGDTLCFSENELRQNIGEAIHAVGFGNKFTAVEGLLNSVKYSMKIK